MNWGRFFFWANAVMLSWNIYEAIDGDVSVRTIFRLTFPAFGVGILSFIDDK